MWREPASLHYYRPLDDKRRESTRSGKGSMVTYGKHCICYGSLYSWVTSQSRIIFSVHNTAIGKKPHWWRHADWNTIKILSPCLCFMRKLQHFDVSADQKLKSFPNAPMLVPFISIHIQTPINDHTEMQSCPAPKLSSSCSMAFQMLWVSFPC